MRPAPLLALLAGLVALQGCTALGLTGGALAIAALGESAAAAARAGTEYTLTGGAYRTFTAPLDEMHEATLATLNLMGIELKEDQSTVNGREIEATAARRTIEIELEPLTHATTLMYVIVKRGFFLRDRATIAEIIFQTELALEARRPPPRPAAGGQAGCECRGKPLR